MEVSQIDLSEGCFDQVVDPTAATVTGSHAHDLGHGERKGDVQALREHRTTTGERARSIGCERAAVQADSAG